MISILSISLSLPLISHHVSPFYLTFYIYISPSISFVSHTLSYLTVSLQSVSRYLSFNLTISVLFYLPTSILSISLSPSFLLNPVYPLSSLSLSLYISPYLYFLSNCFSLFLTFYLTISPFSISLSFSFLLSHTYTSIPSSSLVLSFYLAISTHLSLHPHWFSLST